MAETRGSIIDKMDAHPDDRKIGGYLNPEEGYVEFRKLGFSHGVASGWVKDATGRTIAAKFDEQGKAVVYKAKDTAKDAGDAGEYEEGVSLSAQLSGEITAETVYDDWKAGNVFATDAEVITVLQGMGITNPEAVLRYWKGSDVYPGIAVPRVDGVPVPTPVNVTAGVTPAEVLSRDLLFRRAAQNAFSAFGGTPAPGGTGATAMDFLENRFQRLDPIQGFASTYGPGLTPYGQRAEQFLSGRLGPERGITSPESLRGTLSDILATAQGGTEGMMQFELAFPKAQEAALAQFQPFIQGFNPAMRPRAETLVADRLLAEQARAPSRFVDPFTAFSGFADGILPSR